MFRHIHYTYIPYITVYIGEKCSCHYDPDEKTFTWSDILISWFVVGGGDCRRGGVGGGGGGEGGGSKWKESNPADNQKILNG